MKTLSLLFNKLVSPITSWVSKHYNEYLEAKREQVKFEDENGIRWNHDYNMPEIDPTHPRWKGP